MKKLLWVGDAGVPTGFARATHEVLNVLRHEFDVTVLGMNYRGDPHQYPYPIWAAAAGGDEFGVGRLVWMCDRVKPDVIVVQNDGWNIPFYVNKLRTRLSNGEYAFPEYAGIPIVAVVAVDGKNFQGKWLDGVSLTVFWTQFALDEARAGGYIGPGVVIPLGVDCTVYYPDDPREARMRRIPSLMGKFIVGNVNRNQPRKRWDLLLKCFAEWVRADDALGDTYLYLHAAPTGDKGCHVEQLARYYGVLNRLAFMQPTLWYGISEDEMRDTYLCFDVQVNTGQGEGFGLTTLEGMACGVPQIVTNWSGLGDWTKGASIQVPCSSTAVGPPYVNVLGGVMDEEEFIQALDHVYQNPHWRHKLGEQALARAVEPRFQWSNIGRRYVEALNNVLAPVVWKEEVSV